MNVRPMVLLLTTALLLGACKRTEALPELGAAPGFSLVDQSGQPATDQSLRGQVWAAAFLFTRCPTVCPQMMRAMREVQVQAKERGIPLRLVAFSVDPEHDTPAVLTRFARQYDADLASWTFLTGDESEIDRTAGTFKIALEGQADPDSPDFGILHGSHVVLVDRDGKVRGYYRVRDAEGRARLLDDAAKLR